MKTIFIVPLLIALQLFSQQTKDSMYRVSMKKEVLLTTTDRKKDSLKHPENYKQKLHLSISKKTLPSQTNDAPRQYPAKERISGKKDD